MSADVVIIAVISAFAIIVAFLAGGVFGYGIRVREEQSAYRDERIRTALKHWHGHTSHRGCTIFSPDVVEGGVK